LGRPVVGHVQDPALECLPAGNRRHVGAGKRPRGSDERVPNQAAPAGQIHGKARADGGDLGDAGTSADLDAQPLCVAAQVVGDLVAARVPVGVARERVTREGAVPARREQPQAVVVTRPRPDWLVTGLEHHRLPASVAPGTGRGEAGLPAAHDQQATAAHPSVLVPIWTSWGAGVHHPPDVACSGASNRPDPPHTPVSGSSSSTRSAASWSPASSATTLRTCSYPVIARNVGARS